MGVYGVLRVSEDSLTRIAELNTWTQWAELCPSQGQRQCVCRPQSLCSMVASSCITREEKPRGKTGPGRGHQG